MIAFYSDSTKGLDLFTVVLDSKGGGTKVTFVEAATGSG